MKRFLHELQRRNVIKAAISYIVFSWVLIQAASIVYPSFGWGQKAISNTLIVLIIGFPLWIVFAYVFEWTSKGFKKTDGIPDNTSVSKATGKRLNRIIIIGLSLQVLLLVADRFFNFTGAMKQNVGNDRSIAVLAFDDMSPNKDQGYFSDGISEEILNLLTKIPDLKVISRISSFTFKGKDITTEEIGKKLNVAHILEGSVRKSGNTLRITAQLINTDDGTHVWSETYDREMSDIFKVQDEIAGKVTQHLKTTIMNDMISTPVDPMAYDLYLQAKQVYKLNTGEALKNAETLIYQSMAIDSSYAPTWAFLSTIFYDQIYRMVILPMTHDNITMGMNTAKKAIILDPNDASGYARLARFESANWNFTAANADINMAMSLAPENSDINSAAAINAIQIGKIDEAVRLQLKVLEVDPINYYILFNLGLYYWMLKDYRNAEKQLRTFLLHYPNSEVAHAVLSLTYLELDEKNKAIEELEKEPGPFWKLYRKCMVTYRVGNKEEANVLLKKLIEDWGNVAWPNIASVYAFRGEKDEAFNWLDKAYENRDGSTLEILSYPEMEHLWGDPRWNAFIDKLGLPEDNGFHRDL